MTVLLTIPTARLRIEVHGVAIIFHIKTAVNSHQKRNRWIPLCSGLKARADGFTDKFASFLGSSFAYLTIEERLLAIKFILANHDLQIPEVVVGFMAFIESQYDLLM
ncbi:MAG: hypothetical protein A3C81_02980 [Candidatus Yanofskybacteria bacterium RIFCSPHIGHO2_02_FULL_46_19]|uniref:Uncharacterized protein n=2 Tax=Candidatus Yanofskyibacteriota TaxID=1752733 RepID=A0A1F8H436_9BACT|nr:MAG: hypothetical protein A3C81_02980 [Candidatus Yanofskybacteria bacterium RIFCSPHIGHO2_02_FULL_46_19]OGN27068.1 MAG: hypothetical protein A3B17_02470 [Candidatus Yanofskybacteria bacterium RIFCSPLOWO2_01_FULL_45_72]OGN32353.1 MAG: hypothetical protein A3J01_00295 [Candidatus Yanofskybacteria bacterium RIFCSPLOWO2_02_FULL_45_18]